MMTAALALLVLAQDAGLTVVVATKDGNSITGTTDVAKFTLESSLGKTEIQLKDVVAIRWVENLAIVSASDGTILKGKISQESWKVKAKLGEFTVKTADLYQISIQAARPNPAPAPAPGFTPAPAANPAPPPKPVVNPGLKPAKTLKLAASITRSVRTTDGKKLYLLNASDSKVLLVNLETFQTEKEIALTGGESVMSISPSGNVLVAAGKRTVTVASPSQGKVLKSFSIESDVMDVCMIDDQSVLASTNNQMVMISIPKQAIVSKAYGGGSGGRLIMSRDGKKVYAGGGSILLPDKAQGREEMVASQGGRSGAPEFIMSPDGRFGAAPYGQVFRLGKSYVADMLEVAKVEPHWSSAWAPGAKRLYVATSLGFIKEYDTETWEMSKSWMLGWRISDLFSDDQGTVLYGIGQAVPQNTGSSESPRHPGQQVPPGDLLQFEVPK